MDIEDILREKEFNNLNEFLISEMQRVSTKKLWNQMITTFSDINHAKNWFFTKNPYFENKRPYDLCNTSKINEVYNELMRIEYSAFS